MNKKLLIGIIVVIIVFVIAAAILGVILRNPLYLVNLLTIWIPLGVWIYLVWMVRKKKASLFHDQVEPKIAAKRYKMLKAFLLAAGISLAVAIFGIVGHNVIYGLTEVEEPVFFTIAIVALLVFFIATIGGLVIFLKGRRKQDKEIPK